MFKFFRKKKQTQEKGTSAGTTPKNENNSEAIKELISALQDDEDDLCRYLIPIIGQSKIKDEYIRGELLSRAIWNRNIKAAEMMLDLGIVKINDRSQDSGFRNTALYMAADRGYVDEMVWLIKKGADVNFGDQRGYTPLHRVAHRAGSCSTKERNQNFLDCATLLLDAGADVNAIYIYLSSISITKIGKYYEAAMSESPPPLLCGMLSRAKYITPLNETENFHKDPQMIALLKSYGARDDVAQEMMNRALLVKYGDDLVKIIEQSPSYVDPLTEQFPYEVAPWIQLISDNPNEFKRLIRGSDGLIKKLKQNSNLATILENSAVDNAIKTIENEAEIRKNSRMLYCLSQKGISFFYDLPVELNFKIAALTGDHNVHDKSISEYIAYNNFCCTK